MRRVAPVLAFLVAVASPAAHAAPSKAELATARRLFAEAEREEIAERWAVALEKLRMVIAIKETAGVRFHVAHCEERLGQLTLALADYRRAAELADGLTGAERDDLQKRSVDEITTLEPRLPKVVLTLPEGVAGVAATLDDKAVALTSPPLPIRLDPGEYRLEVKAPGRVTFREKLLLVERSSYTVTVLLPVETPAGARSTELAAASATREPEAAPERAGPPRTTGPSALTWVAGGATLVLAGTSVYFFTRKNALEDEMANACRGVYCDPSRQDGIDSAKTLMIATGAGAILGAGITVALAITSTRTTTATLVVGPRGISAVGAF